MRNINKKSTLATTTWIAATSSSDNKAMMTGKRRTGYDCIGLISPHVTNGCSRKFLLGIALFVLLASVNGATDQKTVQPSPTSPITSSASLSATPKDEIYIDDESIEGSGGRGGLHDDLDKDPDYSGSGFGPDDEDSSTDLQQSHRGTHTQSGKHNTVLTTDDNDDLITSRTHHQTNSGTIIGSNSGSNSGIIGGNSGSNTGLNTIGHTDDEDFDLGEGDGIEGVDDDRKQRIGGAGSSFAGSGDGGDDEDDDDDDHTGDIDEDGHEGLIERPYQRQHEFGVGNEPKSSVENSTSTSSSGSTTSSSTTSTTTTTAGGGGVSSSSDGGERKKILAANGDEDDEHDVDGDEEDEFDETYDEDNKGDDEDDEDDRAHEEDDNTEVYIDGTESKTKSGSDSNEDNERGTTNQGNTIHELDTNNVNSQPTDTKVVEHTTGNEVLIMNTSDDDRTASFFAQPGILAAVIGGAVVGLLCAILVVMFIVYRMRKKDEGSYALDEPKRSPAVNSYAKNANNREFYA